MCLPSHLTSSSVSGAIHTSYMKGKSILCLILLSPAPSPLLSCLPSHLSSSSVRFAIHTSYMKRNSIVILFSSHPTPLSLSNHPPLVTTLWKENYKSAKCNIAFDREVIADPVFFYDFISLPENTGSSILINVGRYKNYPRSQTIHLDYWSFHVHPR